MTEPVIFPPDAYALHQGFAANIPHTFINSLQSDTEIIDYIGLYLALYHNIPILT